MSGMAAVSLILFSVVITAVPAYAESLARITEALPEVDAPPQGDAQWVSRSMRLNGLPMTLKAFQSRLEPGALMHHYESWARSGSNETHRSMIAPWQVLAIKSAGHYITIQARAASGGSEGTIAVSSRLEGVRLKVDTRFPRSAAATIVNLQQYEDHGVESEHISLASPRSVMTEALAFSQLLTRYGWQLIRDQRSQDIRRGHVLEAQKGAQHALLTLLPDQARPTATAIIIVWKKS